MCIRDSISDPQTYELLYLNKASREVYGDPAVSDRPCYEVLQGQSAPCPFCTSHRLTEDTFYEWEHTNTLVNRHYLLRDKLIQWNGKPARLEIAFDVTDLQNKNDSFAFLADAGVMVVDCCLLYTSRCV